MKYIRFLSFLYNEMPHLWKRFEVYEHQKSVIENTAMRMTLEAEYLKRKKSLKEDEKLDSRLKNGWFVGLTDKDTWSRHAGDGLTQMQMKDKEQKVNNAKEVGSDSKAV